MTQKPWWVGGLTVIVLSMWATRVGADPGGYTPPAGRTGGVALPVFVNDPNTLLGAGGLPPGRGPDRYGLHPHLKKFFHIPPGGRCGPGCDGSGHSYGLHGTLVFPHHPFVRSPRDFFMYETPNAPASVYGLPGGR